MPRILVAENDLSLLQLTAELLGNHAQVDKASTAAEALRLIPVNDYDVLVTDLNLERGGEGLLLAGAMRSLHPKARNVLVTGYPDFTSALKSIQSMLDEVHLKPIDPKTLRRLRQHEPERQAFGSARNLTVWDVIGSERNGIVSHWLKLVEADPLLALVEISTADRLDHVAQVVEGFADPKHKAAEEIAAARQHGLQRRQAGYKPEWVLVELSYLRRALFDVIMRELLQLDLSRFPQDMFTMNLRLDTDLLESMRAFGLTG